ncbi:hypothetical protein C0J52_22238 [Blattella germanica]|nr:hypothetical protein C0J52_22238 [Blattella germanica]
MRIERKPVYAHIRNNFSPEFRSLGTSPSIVQPIPAIRKAMGSEQQFCLKWNNHQSTIVAGFDTLLESGTLVDCTLAAEGQYLKAHKVVLSACSPYFELLLSQHDEKHPIVILKDVKFQELKAMVDYMYHGEVNISQDQLGALLKAAESLQIKGLSDSGGGGGERENVDKRHHGTRKQAVPPPQPPRSSPIPPPSSLGHRRSVPQPQPPTVPPIVDLPEDDEPPPARPPPLPRVSSSREGSSSPPPKRKRHRRRSSGGEESLSAAPVVVPLTEGTHETSSSSELPPQSQPAPSTTVPSIPSSITPVVPPSSEPTVPSSQVSEPVTETEMLNRTQQSEVASPRQPPHEMTHEPVLEPVQKVEPQSEVLLEPKSEYLEEDVNEDSVEDLTLDDDMDEMDHPRPGPSHGGEGSSSQGGGCLGQLYSLIQRHVPPPLPFEVPLKSEPPPAPQLEAADLTDATVDTLLRSLAVDVMFRKYSVQNVTRALEAVLKQGMTFYFVTGFAPWHVADQSRDEVFMAAQEAVGAHRDSQAWLTVSGSQTNSRLPQGLMSMAAWTRSSGSRDTGSNPSAGYLASPYQDLISQSNSNRTLSCPRCDRKYAILYTLERHLRYECGVEKQFSCAVCHKKFKRSDVLKVHQRNAGHEDVSKKVSTSLVEQLVRLSLDMRGIFAGMDISTQGLSYVYQFEGVTTEEDGILLHVCQLCGKSYKSRSTLNRHLRYECGRARFKLECSVCGRKFSRPDNLRQHAGIHMPGYASYKTGSGGGNFQINNNA